MKTKILMTACLALILSTVVFANPTSEPPETTRTINLGKSFSLLILTDVKVVLTNGDETDLYITGNQAAAKKIEVLTDGSELMIDAVNLNPEDDVVIHISAKMIDKIVLNGKAEVTSSEILQNRKLNFVVNGDCKVRIKVVGRVDVVAAEGFEFNYRLKTNLNPQAQFQQTELVHR